jgi:hypothetical protein
MTRRPALRLLVIKGDGDLSGRWTRAASAVQDSCAAK